MPDDGSTLRFQTESPSTAERVINVIQTGVPAAKPVSIETATTTAQ